MRAVDPEDCSEHGQKQHRNTRKQGTDHRFVLYWYHSLTEDASSFIQLTEVNTLQSLYSSLSNASDRKSNPVNVWDAPRVLAVQHLKNLFLSIFSFFLLYLNHRFNFLLPGLLSSIPKMFFISFTQLHNQGNLN